MNQSKNSDYVNNLYQMQMRLSLLSSGEITEPQHLFSFPDVPQLNSYQAIMTYNYINSIPMPLMTPNYQYNSTLFMVHQFYQQAYNNFLLNTLEERAKTSENTEANCYYHPLTNTSKEITACAHSNSDYALIGNCQEQWSKTNNKANKQPQKFVFFKTQSGLARPTFKKVFRTRLLKSRTKKRENKKIYKCGHEVCGLVCKTKKQIISHHGKMNQDCQKDTTYLLKGVFKTKQVLHQLIADNKIIKNKEFMRKYEDIMNDVSIKEYAHLICGLTFDDIIERETK